MKALDIGFVGGTMSDTKPQEPAIRATNKGLKKPRPHYEVVVHPETRSVDVILKPCEECKTCKT